ncbi:hypothetical protein JCM10908_004055 [Rhodotorula pacifica]|uniref:uncharacterized protein n=1 Tax=Rhodotorula pacifica TaxID=1495444 RepID=UPI0031764278
MAQSDPDTPLKVQIVVYDLLPPSKLGSLLNLVGAGVYHSSVQLAIPLGPTDSDPTPAEYAFGGHDSPGTTGIFSIPAGTAVQRMPGLRYYTTVDAGEAFGKDWERAFRGNAVDAASDGRRSLSSAKARSPATPSSSESWTTTAAARDSERQHPYRADSLGETRSTDQFGTSKKSVSNSETASHDSGDDDGGEADGTQYMTRAQRRAYRILQEMKRDPEWNGGKYRLLERKCNTFTHELVWRLTGRRAPSWLNRAAWVATAIPCIVPAGWIDEADEAAPDAESAVAHIPDPAHVVSSGDSVTIAPPRADQMSLGGSRVRK